MDRVEFLSKLEERVKNEELIPFRYSQIINGEVCHCILGHALDIIGKGHLLEGLDDNTNLMPYNSLPLDFNIEEDSGLSNTEIKNLQTINDTSYNEDDDDDEKLKKDLLNYINVMKEKRDL